MRLSSLVLAAVLSASLNALAQHSSSGGSSSGSSSGGSSHGGSSGGSSSGGSSSGSHSSSSSGSSVSHSSANSIARTSNGTSGGSTRSASEVRSARGTATREIRATDNARMNPAHSGKMNALPEKRGFVSHLLHPFRKNEVKLAETEIKRRPPICTKGHCACPGGGAVGKHGVCSIPQTSFQCASGYWNGGRCVDYSRFRVGNCSSLELLLQQQAQRAGVAEDDRQASCSSGAASCSEMTIRATDEAAQYRSLQQQLEQCRRQNTYAGSYRNSFGYSAGVSPFAVF